MLAVAKRFRTAGTSGAKSPGGIARSQTLFQATTPYVGVKKTCVEAIAGTDWIDHLHAQCRAFDPFVVAQSYSAFRTQLHYHQRDDF